MKIILSIVCFFILSTLFGQLRNNEPNVYNVKLFGAKGDGVTDDTKAIQRATNACDAGGGGTVWFPNGTYIIGDSLWASTSNSQIWIPYHFITSAARNHITFRGETKPNLSPIGSGWIGSSTSIPPVDGTVILKSTLTASGAAGAAVIGTQGLGNLFNYNYLSVENITIQVKNNPSGTGPVVGGINYARGVSLRCDYVLVYIDTSGRLSTLPVNDIAGIETPDNQADQFNTISNTLVIGFKSGYRVGEHTVLNQAQAFTCYYGFNFKNGSNPVYSQRALSSYCPYDIYISGPATLANFELTSQWQQESKWYDNIATVKDSANLSSGQVYYTFDAGMNANFVKSGGALLRCSPNGAGVAAWINGMGIGNTVASGTSGSALYLTTSGALAQNNSRFFFDGTNFGVGTTAPGGDIEAKSGGNTSLILNTSLSTGSPIIKWQKNGTNKWGWAIDNFSAGNADLVAYDYANNLPRLLFGIAGTINIGGNAGTAAGAAIAIDNSGNVAFDNNAFKWDATNNWLLSPILKGGTSGNLTLNSNTSAGGLINFGANSAYNEASVRLGIGTNNPQALLDLTTSGSPDIFFNTTTSTGSPRFKWQKNGTNKWGEGMDKDGNGTADFYWFDYANSKLRLIINTSGTMFIGGDAQAAPAFTAIASGLVGINRTPTTDQFEVAGNVSLTTAGNKIKIATGANASVGVSGAMTAGTITISTTAVTASSRIQLTHASVAGTIGILSVGTIVAGTSFVINSSSATDTGTVNWWIVN